MLSSSARVEGGEQVQVPVQQQGLQRVLAQGLFLASVDGL